MLTENQRRWVLQRDNYTCRFCGHVGNVQTLEVDHSVPIAQGGTDHGNNLQATCWPCNALKGDRNTRAFESWIRYHFGSRAHFARYSASARASGRLPDLDRWLDNNQPTIADQLFSGWAIPVSHRRAESWFF